MCGISNLVFTFLAYPKGLALETLQGLHDTVLFTFTVLGSETSSGPHDTVLFTLLHCCSHKRFSWPRQRGRNAQGSLLCLCRLCTWNTVGTWVQMTRPNHRTKSLAMGKEIMNYSSGQRVRHRKVGGACNTFPRQRANCFYDRASHP